MIKSIRTFGLLFIFFLLAGCFSAAHQNTVTQVSTIDALLAGVYDGCLPCEKLLQYGNTGLGTFNKLDGEMALIDGILYQVKADGKVYQPSTDILTPFAVVVDFHADKAILIDKPMSLKQFEEEIEKQYLNQNNFYAIQVRGTFSYMKTRSVPAQEKPYLPLAEVIRHQSIFEMTDVSGRIVGFYSPPYVKGINVPGYHLHFISDDLKRGGHILDFVIKEGHVEIDACNRFLMLLPKDETVFSQVDLTKDRASELEKVEKKDN